MKPECELTQKREVIHKNSLRVSTPFLPVFRGLRREKRRMKQIKKSYSFRIKIRLVSNAAGENRRWKLAARVLILGLLCLKAWLSSR